MVLGNDSSESEVAALIARFELLRKSGIMSPTTGALLAEAERLLLSK